MSPAPSTPATPPRNRTSFSPSANWHRLIRALSLGINDPFTAYAGINHLVNGIGKALQRPQLPNVFTMPMANCCGRLSMKSASTVVKAV